MSKKRFNHAFDFAFEVIADQKDGTKLDPEDLREACIKRMQNMSAEEIHEACGLFDSTEDDRPKKKFSVAVCRTGYGHANIEVEAFTAEEAEELALEEAGDHSFSENNSEYTSNGATEIKKQ